MITGDLSPLADRSDKDLFQLRGIHEVWTADHPDSIATAERLEQKANVSFSVFSDAHNRVPVTLFGTPDIELLSPQLNDYWPKWLPTEVD